MGRRLKMSRYSGYTLGLMEFKIDEVACRIKPEMNDVDEALRILAKSKMENVIPISEIKKFCIDLLWNGLEAEEKQDKDAKKELTEFVTMRLLQVWFEVQVLFKLIERTNESK